MLALSDAELGLILGVVGQIVILAFAAGLFIAHVRDRLKAHGHQLGHHEDRLDEHDRILFRAPHSQS